VLVVGMLSWTQVAGAAEILEGRVVGVADGDTVTILVGAKTSIKVRLAEIDAPEKAQAFGQRSKKSLSDLIFGKSVRVTVVDKDRYGRTVGRIFVDGVDVNAEQIRRGMAWVYRRYSSDRDLLQIEEKARLQRLGLWADESPTPPWEYRAAKRSGNAVKPAAPEPVDAGQPCGRKRYCKQMTSCDEARVYLERCGAHWLDRDGDGVPCESLCAKTQRPTTHP
jgi:endonuclease YncB( thermonuclease family)